MEQTTMVHLDDHDADGSGEVLAQGASEERKEIHHNDPESDQSDVGDDLMLVERMYSSRRDDPPQNDHPQNNSERRMQRRSAITSEMVAPDDISYHPGYTVNFFAPPYQRQKWGDTQILPRVNWGDLFFDLFYVAAAYNTSNILVDSPNGDGVLYFVTTFVVVMQIWYSRLFFDSRFVVGDDLWHRIFEIIGLSALAAAIVNIQPLSVLSNSTDYPNMFVYCLSITIANLLAFVRLVELYLWGVGQREVIKAVVVRESIPLLVTIAFLVAATTVTGIDYYGDNGGDGSGHRLLRFLASDVYASEKTSEYAKDSNTNNIPVWLCLASIFAYWVIHTCRVIFNQRNFEDYKLVSVPINIDFVIHRYAEWIMLMLGESILSLLIVDVDESDDYYMTFYSSLIIVIVLQYLHFRSQPHSADDHALRRDKNAAILSVWFQFIYSASLVAFGAAVTLFVLDFQNTGGRRLSESTGRILAGGGNSAFDKYDLRSRAAHLYSASLALTLFSLDTLSILHVGFKRCNDCAMKDKNKAGLLLIAARVFTIFFVATLSQWTDDPEMLSEIGVGVVVFQVLMRLIGYSLFPKKVHVDSHGHDQADASSDDLEKPDLDKKSGSSLSEQQV